MSNSLKPHGLQHARPPCPAPSPGACSDSCPWSQWCHPAVSSSGTPFSSCLQSFPASGSFLMNWLFIFRWPKYWSFSFSVSPPSEDSGLISFRLDWLDHLAVQDTLKGFLQHHGSKASILQCSAFLWSNSHIHTWLLEKISTTFLSLIDVQLIYIVVLISAEQQWFSYICIYFFSDSFPLLL